RGDGDVDSEREVRVPPDEAIKLECHPVCRARRRAERPAAEQSGRPGQHEGRDQGPAEVLPAPGAPRSREALGRGQSSKILRLTLAHRLPLHESPSRDGKPPVLVAGSVSLWGTGPAAGLPNGLRSGTRYR